MFEKVSASPELVTGEHEVLNFWQETNAFEKLRARNAGKRKWSFLDGPITANNPMGVHHAWGRTLKDVFQRYFAMTGHDERYQNGFDCQGLWVEVEVEKELGIGSKRDIENLVPGNPFQSIDKFVTACKQRVDKFARRQTEQTIRLGVWMDWDRDEDWNKPPDQRRSYFTMAEENNYTIWSFLKKCHSRGLIYKAYDSMPWCPRCAVGISQMEMHEGYVFLAHRAVFVRFPLRGRPGENLLVWTTTPWTLTSNVGAAVNPDLTYLKVKHGDEIYFLAKGALTANRLDDEFKRDEWVEGVPKLKSVAQIFKEKGGYEILGELKGAEMLGWTYDGPFDELPAQNHDFGYPQEIARVVERRHWSGKTCGKDAHKVVPWDAVEETEGTGIVHIAPGCGSEDFELMKSLHVRAILEENPNIHALTKRAVAKTAPGMGSDAKIAELLADLMLQSPTTNIPKALTPIAPLDDEGIFLPGFGPFTGKSAVDPETADLIFDDLKAKRLLVAIERYPHNYPHCWRCKTELLFRLVDEWYISMGREDDPNSYRRQIMRVAEDVTFLPESINGKARELDWLKNMGDWMISKKRYWGLALPIWVCDNESCGAFDVIGDRKELQQRASAGWEEFDGHPPHRPWVDLVRIRCAKCGGSASRISDVGNPWLDAGIVPYSTMRYNTDRAYWENWFPADFITESFPGQFRNWFYAILAMSTMMEGRAPMRVLLGHALVRDEHGEEMHKSKGNAIWFDEAAKKMGVDVMRWLYCRQNPTQNLNFGYTPGREVERQVFNTLWNSYAFFVNYARLDEFDPAIPPIPVCERPEIDRWILSNLQLLVQAALRNFEAFNTSSVVRLTEEFIEDLSNWYIRRNRRRFWRSRGEDDRDKLAAYQTLYEVLVTLCKLVAPIIPFVTERMYQNLVLQGGVLKTEDGNTVPASVHHCDFPQPDPALIDETLSFRMQVIQQIVTTGHALREQAGQRVRQPLAEIRVSVGGCTPDYRQALERMQSLVNEELNIKQLTIVESLGDLTSVSAKPNFGALGPRFGRDVQSIAAALAKAPSDVLRKLQAGATVSLEADDRRFEIGASDVLIQVATQSGWAVGEAGCMQIAINSTLTPELRQEGLARDVVRHIQQIRKDQGLNIEDRIGVNYHTDDAELGPAITQWSQYICTETLCDRLATERPGHNSKELSLGKSKLWLEIRKS